MPANGCGPRQLLREALHHDLDDVEGERAKALRLINQARYYMVAADVAYVNPNAPQWAAMADIELVRLDRAVRGDPSPQSAADAVAGKKTLRETDEDLDKESEAQSKKAASALEKAKAEEEEQGDLEHLAATRATPTTRTTSARSSCRTTRGRNKKGWVGGREGGERARVW